MRRHKIKSRLLKVLLEIIKISRKNGLQRISKVFDFKRIVYLFYMVIKNLLSTEYLIMIPVILLYIYAFLQCWLSAQTEHKTPLCL